MCSTYLNVGAPKMHSEYTVPACSQNYYTVRWSVIVFVQKSNAYKVQKKVSRLFEKEKNLIYILPPLK